MTSDEKPKPCPACNGRGYHHCPCWPGDCICGWGDESCDECDGHGFIVPDYDEDEARFWEEYHDPENGAEVETKREVPHDHD